MNIEIIPYSLLFFVQELHFHFSQVVDHSKKLKPRNFISRAVSSIVWENGFLNP